MKLMIINPDWGMTREQMDYRCRILSQYVGSDTALAMECLTQTEIELDFPADIVMAGPEIVRMAVKAEQEGYDAVILYCFSDPALEACRQAVTIPVIGGAQAACLLAPVLGYQCGVILASESRIPEKRTALGKTGLSADRILGYESVDAHGLEISRDREVLLERLAEAGERLIAGTGAQVIVLGCLSFLGMSRELGERLGVPVIDPAAAAVSEAERVVRLGLTSSTRAYPGRQKIRAWLQCRS